MRLALALSKLSTTLITTLPVTVKSGGCARGFDPQASLIGLGSGLRASELEGPAVPRPGHKRGPPTLARTGASSSHFNDDATQPGVYTRDVRVSHTNMGLGVSKAPSEFSVPRTSLGRRTSPSKLSTSKLFRSRRPVKGSSVLTYIAP
jgi:hypothetical protein